MSVECRTIVPIVSLAIETAISLLSQAFSLVAECVKHFVWSGNWPQQFETLDGFRYESETASKLRGARLVV
jgi:hypothetical protein